MLNLSLKSRGDRARTQPVREQLRVAIVTASLGISGAEKQAFYIVRALAEAGVAVRVYNLSRGGKYEVEVRRLQVEPEWIGRWPHPVLRLPLLVTALQSFRPNVIQSIHAYTNLYSAIAGKMLHAVSIGGLRGDLSVCLDSHPWCGKYLMGWPDGIVVNSKKALEEAKRSGLANPARVHFLPNGIDLSCFPLRDEDDEEPAGTSCNCVTVGRLISSKRVDVFLRALAAARSRESTLTGTIIGYGQEMKPLQKLAAELQLGSDHVRFTGYSEDVTNVLGKSSVFVFCSESEGTPNVILEAMAASLPVITTPAGDSADLVQEAAAGYVVQFGNVDSIADAMVRLARSRTLRRELGAAGRDYVERNHAASDVGARLLEIYSEVARGSVYGRQSDRIERFRNARRTTVASGAGN